MSRVVYIASALPNAARASALADALEARGALVSSTWHDSGATVAAERELDTAQRASIALQCLREIDVCDTFVWLHGNHGERVGAAVEYGYALARGKNIYLVALSSREAPSVFGALGPEVSESKLLEALS